MKKFITLLFSLGAFATSFAQYNHRDNRYNQYANSSHDNWNYSKERRHFDHGNIFSAKERDFQIEKINRDFVFRVKAIQHDRYLRRREKKAAIRNAETERSRQIQLVNDRFNCNY